MVVPLQYRCAVSAADVVCNLSGVGFVVHKQELEFPNIVDKEFLETVGEEMSRPLVASVTNLVKLISIEFRLHQIELTLGMAICPLKRRLTLLSIPLGFRHASLTLW